MSEINTDLAKEWLPELQGSEGRKQLREMSDNDPVTGGILNAITLTIRAADITVTPGADDRATELINTNLGDMAESFENTMAAFLDFLPMGFSPHEICYKVRDGEESRYSDGLIAWHSFPQIAQETVGDWHFDKYGQVDWLVQNQKGGKKKKIPREKMLLFRTTTRRGNPEGRSIFRNAWTSYYIKRNLQIVQAIAAERGLAGLPHAKIPLEIINNAMADASSVDAQIYMAWQELVSDVRMDRKTGIITPSDTDPDSKVELYSFGFTATPSGHNLEILPILEQLDSRIAVTCLADIILLGHQAVGTQALAKEKQSLFITAIGSFLDALLAELNTRAIPELLLLNGMAAEEPPKLVHGPLAAPDLAVVGSYIRSLKGAGFELNQDPNGPLTSTLLRLAHMPENPAGMAELVAQQKEQDLQNQMQALEMQTAIQSRAQQANRIAPGTNAPPPENNNAPNSGRPRTIQASELLPPPNGTPADDIAAAEDDILFGLSKLVAAL